MINTKIDRLQSQLNISGLKAQNPALAQIVSSLIDAMKDVIKLANTGSVDNSGLQAIVNSILSTNFLTSVNESVIFTNSRQLLAGDFISFNDSIANERTVSSPEWSVLTNGNVATPELIFADGDVIMVHIP